MMRSLFSGVAGLKTHQTRMDVIGNNIANVNTTAYKSQSMVFNDLLYQTTQAASGANTNTGRGGINPRQIGLGAKTGAISTAIETQGSAQSTNNPWDVMIEGDLFFIVNDGSQNFFTRDGSFTVDGSGNLVMSSTGFTVMGWQVDPETGDIRSDVVSALRIMHPDNLTAAPEATSMAYMNGILDRTDTSINSTEGVIRTLTFFDAQGYEYTAKFSVHGTGNDDVFRVQLDDILDSTGMSLVEKYNLSNIDQIASFGDTIPSTTTSRYDMATGVTYHQATGAAGDTDDIFYVEQALSSILADYDRHAMVVAAGNNNVRITDIQGKDMSQPTVDVAENDQITVEGSITLTRAQLEAEPYNLIYNTADQKYYRQDGPDSSSSIVIDGANDAEIAQAWADALRGMEGLNAVTVSSIAVDGENVTISFTDTFTASQASTYNTGTQGFNTAIVVNDDNMTQIKEQVYNLQDGDGKKYGIVYIGSETTKGNQIVFDHDTGLFSYVGSQGRDTATLTFNTAVSNMAGETVDLSQFGNIEIDFASITNFGNGGKCTLEMTNGSKDNSALGSGRKVGALIGVEIGQDGRITASYDNGLTKLLGQIAVAEFANASGLSKAGNNLYSATQNSGEFDGVGVDITANGGQMTSGVLEMSNVDLSSEFTTMITTQRGFQANSRIITVSDTMLEELVNLKR